MRELTVNEVNQVNGGRISRARSLRFSIEGGGLKGGVAGFLGGVARGAAYGAGRAIFGGVGGMLFGAAIGAGLSAISWARRY